MSFENLSTRTTVIDGDTWSCNPFPASKGVEVLKRLTKVMGTSLATLLNPTYEVVRDEEGRPVVDSEGNPELREVLADGDTATVRAVKHLVANLDQDNICELLKVLVGTTLKNEKKVEFDTEFATRYDVLFSVCMWVFKENFSRTFHIVGM